MDSRASAGVESLNGFRLSAARASTTFWACGSSGMGRLLVSGAVPATLVTCAGPVKGPGSGGDAATEVARAQQQEPGGQPGQRAVQHEGAREAEGGQAAAHQRARRGA